ncbi:unnamed protein product, partial [Didymodactylos carnosus]
MDALEPSVSEMEEKDITTNNDRRAVFHSNTNNQSNLSIPNNSLQLANGGRNLNEVFSATNTVVTGSTVSPLSPPSFLPISSPVGVVSSSTSPRPYLKVTQSKWVKEHLNTIEQEKQESTTAARRVEKLRNIFENPSSDSPAFNSPQSRRPIIDESEEYQPKHGNEVRYWISDHPVRPTTIINLPYRQNTYHILPPEVELSNKSLISSAFTETRTELLVEKQKEIPPPYNLDDITHITNNKQIQSLYDIGYYLIDGKTWKWNQKFWLSLTQHQHDQLTRLHEQQNKEQILSVDTDIDNVKHITDKNEDPSFIVSASESTESATSSQDDFSVEIRAQRTLNMYRTNNKEISTQQKQSLQQMKTTDQVQELFKQQQIMLGRKKDNIGGIPESGYSSSEEFDDRQQKKKLYLLDDSKPITIVEESPNEQQQIQQEDRT